MGRGLYRGPHGRPRGLKAVSHQRAATLSVTGVLSMSVSAWGRFVCRREGAVPFFNSSNTAGLFRSKAVVFFFKKKNLISSDILVRFFLSKRERDIFLMSFSSLPITTVAVPWGRRVGDAGGAVWSCSISTPRPSSPIVVCTCACGICRPESELKRLFY